MEWKFNEYLLIVEPGEHANTHAINFKSIFKRDYHCSHAANLKPHITIANFILFGESMEKGVLNFLEKTSKSTEAFYVEIDGFGHFSTHTIFLKIITKNAIVKIVNRFKKFRQDLTAIDKYKPVFITNPHLTIARGMRPEQFGMAWPNWENENFTSSFKVNELVLLKREFINKTRYKEVGRFPLTGDSNEGQQLVLQF